MGKSEGRKSSTRRLQDVLEDLQRGRISSDEAARLIRANGILRLGETARLDVGRESRRGVLEVVFGEKKTIYDLIQIARRLLGTTGQVIITRLSPRRLRRLAQEFEGKAYSVEIAGRTIRIVGPDFAPPQVTGRVGVLTAGTSDISVAEEARLVAEAMGCRVWKAYDVGVAGLHRLFGPLKEMLAVGIDVLVVCAGMEGALPSVVAGLVDVPVIGVPTSVGYGVGGQGRGALLAMLQSCAQGLAVVNVDNGVAAGTFAALIARRCGSRASVQSRASTISTALARQA